MTPATRRSQVSEGFSRLWRSRRGAQLVGYLMLTGLVAVASLVAVGIFNQRSEQAIQKHSDVASRMLASADPGTSLGEDVSKAVAEDVAAGLVSGAPSSAGMMVAAGAFKRRTKKEQSARDLPGDKCEGGQCTNNRCFVAGTLVLTPTGLRPIEEIQVGDLVMVPAQ